MPIGSMDFWGQDQERRSQRLYVAFCEFASSALDYATGLDMLRRGTGHRVRLNWSSTAFYYSLVHSGRFLAFVAKGDFPTSHEQLHRCFQRQDGGAKTDWLKRLVREVQPSVGDVEESLLTVDDLINYWESAVRWDRAQNFLEWLGEILKRAKQLRNENNYEALLIAREFRHRKMSLAFSELAETMRQVSRKALRETAQALAAYLVWPSNDAWEWPPEGKRPFVQQYVNRGVIEPLRQWYKQGVSAEVDALLLPVSTASGPIDRTLILEIEQNVSRQMFEAKGNLMEGFEQEIHRLRMHLDPPVT